ncbi:oligosaccharide flippase family protein [Aliarcobacter trophiarum]|uniref:oligosaccharide flippase family protein n=1 Tax=Aliarcobacter trophiarum TaxID=708186 RepID=UPI00100B96DB|nr:oligosaccharide flippase family protein [Aliarcobacter trophiarum]RXI25324.1 hypothetical protein CRU89_08120 [Aliarcobacter trophiarum]
MLNKLKPKSEFSRNVLTLMTGTTIAQAIPIAISPILTRIYTPEDFGVFTLYIAIVSLISIFATAQYDIAIVLPKSDIKAINLMALSLLICCIVVVFTMLCIFLFKNIISEQIEQKELLNFIYLIPLSVLLMGIYQIFNYWSNRKKYYKIMAINRTTQSLTTASSNVLIGLLSRSGLILGQLIGQMTSTLLLLKFVYKKDKNLLRRVKIKYINLVSIRYIKFPKVNILLSVINSFYNNSKYIIFGFIFLPNVIGQLYLVYRVLGIPSSIIGTSIAEVLLQDISSTKSTNDIRAIYKRIIKTFLVLLFTALLPSLIIFLYGEFIFGFVFGNNWLFAGKIASILIIGIIFEFSISPFCKLFFVFDKNEIYLIWEILRLFIIFTPLFILYFFNYDLIYILWTLSYSIAISYLLLFVFLYKILKD